MAETVLVPDLGGEGQVIEILVNIGDKIIAEQSLVTLESDKASMEVPSPKTGVVTAIHFKIGDTLKEGDKFIDLEAENTNTATQQDSELQETVQVTASTPTTSLETVLVPDLGGEGQVIEILVNIGDKIIAEQSLVTLESDKASMEVPSPKTGTITQIFFKIGDTMKEGDKMIEIQTAALVSNDTATQITNTVTNNTTQAIQVNNRNSTDIVYAGPGARALAREMNINLHTLSPTGPRGRITKDDVKAAANNNTTQQTSAQNNTVSSQSQNNKTTNNGVKVDFSKFGAVREMPLTKLMLAGGNNLLRNWNNIPHVTQCEDADITDLEKYRKSLATSAEKAGVKVTLLPLLMKAVACALRDNPTFNASLNDNFTSLILKDYINIGFAADTPDGLLVPVIKNVDQKGIFQIAREISELATRARDKKLVGDDMKGGCFTISSLGHIGGTYFTPIVNAPEVAILGVCKASMRPVWDSEEFKPRLMLPLSLSYDHRAINGAGAAKFNKSIANYLARFTDTML